MGQSQTMTPSDEKSRKTIADYVADMAALESHIEAALDHQLREVQDDPIASEAIRGFHTMVKSQRDAIKALKDELGSPAANPVKEVGSVILGKAAGLIDKIRTEGISKSIRDDYAAFNLAVIGYTMLNTTALALGDRRTADIAERHLTGYAAAIQRINHIIPDVVVAELRKDNHTIQSAAADQTRKIVDTAWKKTDQAGTIAQTMAG